MSNEVVTGAVASDGSPDSTPPAAVAPTFYQAVIAERIKELWQLAAKVPNLEFGHPDDSNFVRTHRNVPIAGIENVVANIQQTPDLQAATRLDLAQAQDDLQLTQGYQPLIVEVRKLLSALTFTSSFRRARVTGNAQQSAAITKAMARMHGANHIAAVYETMKSALKRKRKTVTPPIIN